MTHGIGLFNNSKSNFYLDNNNDSKTDEVMGFGPPDNDWKPVAGDFDGNGEAGVGLYNGNGFFIDNDRDGKTDMTAGLGPINNNWEPISGDFNGDGETDVGLYNGVSRFYLDYDKDGKTDDTVAKFAPGKNLKPVAGDFDGDGEAGLALYNGNGFFIDNDKDGKKDKTVGLGPVDNNYKPLAGDFDGDGSAGVGLYNGYGFLLDTNKDGATDKALGFGPPDNDWQPVAGVWGDKVSVSLSADASAYEEGDKAIFSLESDFSRGTKLGYVLGGDIDVEDIAAESLKGAATVNKDGSATISVDLLADSRTEGKEKLNVSLTDYDANASTIVEDSSTAPIEISADAGVYEEGQTSIFSIESELSRGTKLNYVLGGDINVDDIAADSLNGTVTVGKDGIATISAELLRDDIDEGKEELTVSLEDYGVSASTGVVGADTKSPTLKFKTPTNGAKDVSLKTKLKMSFDEIVEPGKGYIEIIEESSGKIVEKIDVNGDRVTFEGSIVKVEPSEKLKSETEYYIKIEPSDITDDSGNAYRGITDKEAWSFKTTDATAPKPDSLSPSDNAKDVKVATDLAMSFDEEIELGTGKVEIYKKAEDTTVEEIDIRSDQVKLDGKKLKIAPSEDLASETDYYINVTPDAIKDKYGNAFAGISSMEAWDFTTMDSRAPELESLTPSDDSEEVETGTDLSMWFNEKVKPGTGSIEIVNKSDDTVAEEIDISSDRVTFEENKLTAKTSKDLEGSTEYYVNVQEGAVKDDSGNAYTGITDRTIWDFTTARAGKTVELTSGKDIVEPEVASAVGKAKAGDPGEGGTDSSSMHKPFLSLLKSADTEAGITTTSRGDLINGTSSSTSKDNTLNSVDQIDGGKGADKLNLDMQSDFDGFEDGKLVNVETIGLVNKSSVARDFNATGVEDVEKYILNADKAALNLADLTNSNPMIQINNQASGSSNISFAEDSEIIDSTSDTLNMTLNNVGTVDDPETDANEEEIVNLNVDNIEELALTASDKNVLNLEADSAQTLILQGSGSLKIDDIGNNLKTFNAAEYLGSLNVDLKGSENMDSVVTGQGDDVIHVNIGDNLKLGSTLDAGEGYDTLSLNVDDKDTVRYSMAGIEEIKMEAVNRELKFSGKNSDGIEKLIASSGLDDDIHFIEMGSSDITIDLLGENTSENSISSHHEGATTINATASSTADKEDFDKNNLDIDLNKTKDMVNLNVSEFMEYRGNITAPEASGLAATIDGKLSDSKFNLESATSGEITITNGIGASLDLQAPKMRELIINKSENLDLTDSDLSNLEDLEVNTAGLFEVNNLEGINSVELTGVGSVELGKLGSEDRKDSDITITAVDLSGDGSSKDASLEVDSIMTKDTDIKVDASEVMGNVELGDINAENGASSAADVELNFDGTLGDVTLDKIKGDEVVVNAMGVLGDVNYNGDILVESRLDFTGAENASNDLGGTIEATGSSLQAELTGGIEDDAFEFDVDNNDTKELSVSGDLRLGNNRVSIDAKGRNKYLDIDVSDLKVGDPTVSDKTGVVIQGGSATEEIKATPGADEIYGNKGQDLINGKAGNDTIEGGAGNDYLSSGSGADSLIGGSGDDYLIDGKYNKSEEEGSVDDNPNEDTLKGGAGDDTLIAGAGSDTLKGETGADTLNGGAGNDTLNGGDGDDTLKGGAWNDTLSAGSGNDTLKGGSGRDTLIGDAGDDTIDLGDDSDADTIKFNKEGDGKDTLQNFAVANDSIDFSYGESTVKASAFALDSSGDNLELAEDSSKGLEFGADSTDLSSVGSATVLDTTFDIPEDDIVISSDDESLTTENSGINAGNDLIVSFSAEGKSLAAGKGSDRIIDHSGNANTLNGGEGDDVLTGGDGGDTLTGGANDDSFVFDGSVGSSDVGNTVTDFGTASTQNTLDFTTVASSGTGITAANYQDAAIADGDGATTAATGGFAMVSDSTDGDTATSLSEADVATYLGDVTGTGNAFEFNNKDNVLYIAVTDGTDTGVYLADDANGDTAIDEGDLTLLGTLEGETAIAANQLADFT